MHIVVLGAGIIGITTAYQLLKDGHNVTVIERETGPAQFTSFANAGLVAPGHAYAWGSPAAPGMMWRSFFRNDQAIRFKPRFSLRQWRWALAFLGECSFERAAVNTQTKARLCRYSQSMLEEVVSETEIEYDGRTGGLLYFYRDPSKLAAATKKADILRSQGLTVHELTRDQVVEKDPGLSGARERIAGGLYAATDASGDAHLFTRALADKCRQMGCNFIFGTKILDIRRKSDIVVAVSTSKGEISGDSFVICLGVCSPFLAEKLGVQLPVYPVKGYSITVLADDLRIPPRLGGVDEENLLAYCPMGNRLRLTATAEIAGYSTQHSPADFTVMLRKARELFGPELGASGIEYWAGLRPMTPTGLPIVDRSPIDNLFINTGHGHMGWTMSNGCARMVADIMGQKPMAHSNEGMSYAS